MNFTWVGGRKARILLLLVLLTGAILAGLFWPRDDELARWKAVMKTRGEKLTMSELAPPFAPESLAHEIRFSNAVSRLKSFPLAPGTLVLMRAVGRGRAEPAWAQPAPIPSQRSQISWDDVVAQMDENADMLREIRDLLEHWPAGSTRDYRLGVNVGVHPLITKRKAAQTLADATVIDLHRNSLGPALTNLHALFSLARLDERECLLVDQMIRVAITGLAVSATWEALQATGLDDAQLAALQADLERTAMLPNMPGTFEMERAFVLAAYEEARTNRNGPGALVGGMGLTGNGGFAQQFNDRIYAPLWRSAWSRQDELIFLKAMEPVGQGVRQAQTNLSFQAMRGLVGARKAELAASHGLLDKFRFQMAEAAQVNWDKASLALMRSETMRQMAIVATALKRRQLKYGKLPEGLAPLVPEFVAAVPRDYMNGEPLSYAKEEDGGFILHSVGENGRNESGQGDDLVWLKPFWTERR